MLKIEIKRGIIIGLFILIICTLFIYVDSLQIEIIQLTNQSKSQMMGYIIKTKNDKVIVIDGGTKADKNGLKTEILNLGGIVDAWFLTHPHHDHAGTFLELVQDEDIKINKVYVSLANLEWYYKNESNENRLIFIEELFKKLDEIKQQKIIEEVYLNQEIKIDNIKFEILGTKNLEITENPINNSSMVIKMYFNKKEAIFLADLGKEGGEKLIRLQKNKLRSDIVQMAHHGQNGVDKDVYEYINPTICLWPTTDWLWNNDSGNGENSGNFKTFETRSWMSILNVKINYIQKDGVQRILIH